MIKILCKMYKIIVLCVDEGQILINMQSKYYKIFFTIMGS